MPLFLFIALAFWGAGVSAQSVETEYAIVISPPARPLRNAPALIDARYFSGRFIFYFNDRVKRATWNGELMKLAALEEGAAIVVHAGPLTRKYPKHNELKTFGPDRKAKTYAVTFVPQYQPKRGAPPAVARVTTFPAARVVASSAIATPYEAPGRRSRLRLVSFEVLAFISSPPDGNRSFSPLVAWTPQWHLGPELSVGLSVGFSPMKTVTRGFFTATEYLAEVELRREHWMGYLGGGVQVWHQRLGVNALGALGVRYFHHRLRDKSQAWLTAGYSAYLPTGEWIHQLRFGLGFEI